MVRTTPLQNRGLPDGRLVAIAARGTMMGNRGGKLHRADQTLGTARWRSKGWICCEIIFRNRHRQVMGDSYTEIFFLDEATALAAGHRPCFECRRRDALRFVACWDAVYGSDRATRAPDIDRSLHAARLRQQDPVALETLPAGTICTTGSQFWLIGERETLRWTAKGYRPTEPGTAPNTRVVPCTPAPIQRVLAAGYTPHLHPSAAVGQG